MSEGAPRSWKRELAMTLGVALCLGALYVALTHVDVSRITSADPRWLLVLALLVIGNIFTTSLVFWAVTRSFDATPTVRFGKMTQLIAASALMNYLPVLIPAGQVGRAAYLKLKHDLPLRQSILIVLIVFAISAVVTIAVVGAALSPVSMLGRIVIGVVVLMVASLWTGPITRKLLKRKLEHPWAWIPFKVLDTLVTAARLYVAFTMLGEHVTVGQVVVAASAGMFVSLLPLTPNGLGLREWVVAGLTELMTPTHGAVGMAASLLDRGVEAIVLVVAGTWAAWKLKE